MGIWRKMKSFVILGGEKRKLLMEAALYLAWARFLKIIPFQKLATSLGIPMEETTKVVNLKEREVASSISDVLYLMSRYTFWESECLVKAIAGMKMLKRRGIASTIYFGIAKDESGKMTAHAWLRSGSYYVTGTEGMERFTVVGKFANRICENNIRGKNYE